MGNEENMGSSGTLPQGQVPDPPLHLGVKYLRISNTALQIVLFFMFIIYNTHQHLYQPTHFSRTTNSSSSMLQLHLLSKDLGGGKIRVPFKTVPEESSEKLQQWEGKPHNPIIVRPKVSFLSLTRV